MNHQRRTFVRFEGYSNNQYVNENFKNVRGRLKKVYEKIKTVENWRKTVMFLCVVALAFDPLFFFIPVIDSRRFCFTLDKKLGVAVCVLRTFIDLFYVIHIIFNFKTELIAPRSQVSLRGEIIEHSKVVRKRRILLYFIVDVLSVLPIPQIVVLALILRKQQTASLVTKEILKWVMLCQYIPRSIRIYPIFIEVTRVSGTVVETKWVGATLNLFLYLLPSHVIGAFWYLSAIEKKDKCWREVCSETPGCNPMNQYCERGGGDNSRFLNTSCPLIDPDQITNSTIYNFGMYIDALKSGMVESRDFQRKFIYCFWWGLRNLSALGQNLKTSNAIGEMLFAIIICVSGLLLFAVLIGNVQKYLQSTTIRLDEMEEKKRDTENWMSNRMLPEGLRVRIRRYKDYKWRETRGTEEDTHLRSLPKDLRLETQRHLYMNFLKRVPQFQALDVQFLDEICARLKTVLYTKNSCIMREGEPVEDMFFIMRGNVLSSTAYGSKTGFYKADILTAGDYCGDLLTWALLDPDSTSDELPISNRTIEALTEVEGVVLSADDLKFIFTQYHRLHNKVPQNKPRPQLLERKIWAARFIQTTWRRYCIRKLSKALCEEEGKLRNTLVGDGIGSSKLNLGATIHALNFAYTSLRNLRANAASRDFTFPEMLSYSPHKPIDNPKFPIDEA